MSNRKSCSYVTFFPIRLHLRLPAKPFLNDENNLQSRRWTTVKKLVFLSFLWVQLLLLVCFIKLLSLSNKTCLISLGLHGFHFEVEVFLKALSAVNLRRLVFLVNFVSLRLYFTMCTAYAHVRGCVCVVVNIQLTDKWVVRRMLTQSLSSPFVLRHNYYIIKYMHLKCTVWYILMYVCTYETKF